MLCACMCKNHSQTEFPKDIIFCFNTNFILSGKTDYPSLFKITGGLHIANYAISSQKLIDKIIIGQFCPSLGLMSSDLFFTWPARCWMFRNSEKNCIFAKERRTRKTVEKGSQKLTRIFLYI